MGWLGRVPTPEDRAWLEQRQIELVVRAMQTMQGGVLLARHRLWAQAAGLARMLLEDAAVAHWLADHPDVEALKVRWSEHLDAVRLADFKAQKALGFEVDKRTQEWHASQDAGYLDHISRRHRGGTAHWTGRSIAQLVEGAAGRGTSAREDWAERTQLLRATQQRMLMIVSLGVHHSPSASQNWYAPPDEMLPDPLRVAWLAFGLHARLGLEHFAPESVSDLEGVLHRQTPTFSSSDNGWA